LRDRIAPATHVFRTVSRIEVADAGDLVVTRPFAQTVADQQRFVFALVRQNRRTGGCVAGRMSDIDLRNKRDRPRIERRYSFRDTAADINPRYFRSGRRRAA
jgi:hypothetical protein